ncbi:phage portal protein [Bacillus sp. F19]|nr:phage portal protein [Bacillus sp. F19]
MHFKERNDYLMGFLDKLFSKADIETRAEPTVDGSFSLDSLFVTDAITEEKVLKIPTAKACLDLITSNIAQMPVYLYKENPDGSIEKITDKRVKLLNHESNEFLNGYGLKKNMAKDFLLHGASYVSIIEAGNTILELHPLPARSVLVQKRVQNGYRTVGADILLSSSENGATNDINRKPVKFKPYELMITLQETHDGLTSKGIISYGQDIFKQAMSEIEYTKNLYERGALPLGLLKTAGRMTEEQANTLRTAWANLYGGVKNSAKTVVLQEGMDYQALSLNPEEMQLTQAKQGTNSEICKLFNVPEGLVNPHAKSYYTSIEQNQLHFLKHTLAPIISVLEASMDRALLLESEKDSGYFFRFDTSELVRATEQERVETAVTGIQGGLFTINEARTKFDLPAIPDDKLLITPGAQTKSTKGENADGKTESDGAQDD